MPGTLSGSDGCHSKQLLSTVTARGPVASVQALSCELHAAALCCCGGSSALALGKAFRPSSTRALSVCSSSTRFSSRVSCASDVSVISPLLGLYL